MSAAAVAAVFGAAAACGGDDPTAPAAATASETMSRAGGSAPPPSGSGDDPGGEDPGPDGRGDESAGIYRYTTSAEDLSPNVADARPLVYVPNSDGNAVDVIDPITYEVVDRFVTGAVPQHVVPSWDLSTLYVTNNQGNSLTPIDPETGKVNGPDIPVDDPYNMYFTPDGEYAMVVAEALQRLDFYDPRTWELQHQIVVDCPGVDHADFSADLSYFIATCEFSGKMVKVDLTDMSVDGYIVVGGMPQDIRLDPQGEVFYAADMHQHGVHLIDGATFTKIGFIPTGLGAHSVYPSRDGKSFYVANRGEGSVSVIDPATRQVTAKWQIPGGGSPDMGGVSVDGKQLWLTGRYHAEVYVISTIDGALIKKIPVGPGPHGAAVWPQPGRYSFGHTGNMR